MRTLEYKIPDKYNETRVLSFLKSEAGLSSRLIRNLKMHENGLLLNGVHTRTVDILHMGDILTVNIPDDTMDEELCVYEGTDFGSLQILYEDDDLIAVNKPAMLAIHPSHNHQRDTLANLLAGYLKSKNKKAVFRAVGRLDKGTSGIVVCALNAFAANKLQGKIEKTYFAIPSGIYTEDGTVDAPIYRPDPIKTYRTVDERGDRAVTHFRVIKAGEMSDGTKASFVRVNIETGRTHQIRVHFASLGTPLLGDTMYGVPRDDISHQALHCGSASFCQPFTGETISLSAPIPDDMQKILDNIHKIQK